MERKPPMKPDISVIVPAFNEEGAISLFFTAANDYVSSVDLSVQYVFVDDGSSDCTYESLCNQSIKGASVKVVKLARNSGAHAAIRAGFSCADADFCVAYAMDMPEPMNDMSLFYAEYQKGNEVVYSTRHGYKGSLGSRIYAKMVDRYINIGFPSEGVLCIGIGPKAKAELNNNIENNSSYGFQIFQMGFKRTGIETDYVDREVGSSKWSFNKKVKLFIDSFVMFSYMPIRAISILGAVFALIGIAAALLIIIFKIFHIVEFAAGWPTTSSLLLIGFGITNISLGIIAEYLVRTLDAVRNRPAFIVDEIHEQIG